MGVEQQCQRTMCFRVIAAFIIVIAAVSIATESPDNVVAEELLVQLSDPPVNGTTKPFVQEAWTKSPAHETKAERTQRIRKAAEKTISDMMQSKIKTTAKADPAPYVETDWNSNTCPDGYEPVGNDEASCNEACTYLHIEDGKVSQTYDWGTGHAGGCGEHSGDRCLINTGSGGPSTGSRRICKAVEATGDEACRDLADSMLKEVSDSVDHEQKTLNDLPNGSDCQAKGDAIVNDAQTELDTANSNLASAEKDYETALNTEVDLGKHTLSSLHTIGSCYTDLVEGSDNYKTAQSNADAASSKVEEAKGAVATAEENLEQAKKESKATICECKDSTEKSLKDSTDEAKKASEAENLEMWEKGKHMHCVLDGLTTENCDTGTVPTLTQPPLDSSVANYDCTYEVVTPDYSFCKASSVWDNNAIGYSHGTGRLDSGQAWSAATNQAGEWWQMDLGAVNYVTGVVTQGRHDNHNQWVSSFSVKVSSDGSTFTDVDGGAHFTGNAAANDDKKENKFASAVAARYVRIVVQAWSGHVSMRSGTLVYT